MKGLIRCVNREPLLIFAMIYRCKFRSGVGRDDVDDENRDGDDDCGSGYPENEQATKMVIMMMTRTVAMMMTRTVAMMMTRTTTVKKTMRMILMITTKVAIIVTTMRRVIMVMTTTLVCFVFVLKRV